ncbi:hypothetical protein RhiXN_10372 [Rhizoctonia solani]|uniref:Endonuclease/exonuclease/phosphatase domain-containing protein n=1 Tax=Rhizoctonia solani TaxID=456999 RepID=A0A8H8P3M2_9AGAM|nr:uncharacterized protein RhiXN_10372 [Rhizoctonia solani]QRW24048.1 hypothetical protein RhiXN_10372 [Rhizoctonia solani]
MSVDTGQFSDPISDFSDLPSISTRASNVIRRYTSSFSINSKKSKNNDGSTSISATSSPPDLKRKSSLPSIKTAHYTHMVPDSQVSIECASTCAFVADAGMDDDSDENSSNRSSLSSRGISRTSTPSHRGQDDNSDRSHTPTQNFFPREAKALPDPEMCTQQILDEDEKIQGLNSFNDVHLDLTKMFNSDNQCVGNWVNSTPNLLRDILETFRVNMQSIGNISIGMSRARDNMCFEMSKICNEFADLYMQVINDNNPQIEQHGQDKNPTLSNTEMEVDGGDLCYNRGYETSHKPRKYPYPRTFMGRHASIPSRRILQHPQPNLLQVIISVANDIKSIKSRMDRIENQTNRTPPPKPKPQPTQPHPKGNAAPPNANPNPTAPPKKKTMAQVLMEGPKDKTGESQPSNTAPPPVSISKGTEASAVRFIFRFSHGAPDDTKKTYTLRAHSNPSAISQMEPQIRNALGLRTGCAFTRDTKWSKVIIAGVPTGFSESGDDQVITKNELMDEVRKHKSTEKLTITQVPDWTIRPEDIKSSYGSIAFAFEDPDGLGATNQFFNPATAVPRTATSKPTATGNLGVRDVDTAILPNNTTINANYATTRLERKGPHALTQLDVAFADKTMSGIRTRVPKGLIERGGLSPPRPLYAQRQVIPSCLDPHDPRPLLPFWMCFSPPGISGPKGPGVSIYVRRDIPDLHARYSDTLPPHPDVLAIDVIYKGSRTTLVNAYLHGDSERYDESLNHLICHPYPTSHPIIIAGDFNAHHPNWALEGSKWVNNLPNPSARLLDNWASENDFHVLNDLTVPTRNGKKGQADSIIDLTLLNSIAVDAFVDFDWTCEAEGAMGSDHNIISWAIGAHDQTDAATHPKPPPTFTIDPELEEEWTNAFVAHLSNENLPSQPKHQAN